MTEMVSLKGRAKVATTCLALIAVVDAIAAWISFRTLGFLDRAALGQVTAAEANDIDQQAMTWAVVYLITLVVCAIAYVRWFHRAYKNTLSVEHAPAAEFTPAQAVTAWFIPFVNLVRPYQIARNIWAATAKRGDPSPDSGSSIITAWWVAWIGSGVIAQVLLRRSDPHTLEQIRSLQYKWMITNLAALGAAVLAIIVVKRITDRQEDLLLAPAKIAVPSSEA